MTIRHLRVFLAVYQNMSTTRASELLNLAQPAVSRSIQELEEDCGFKLFERMNHRLYPTSAGDEFYAKALHIVEAFDSLQPANAAESLRVGSTITIGNFLLPTVAAQFKSKHPDIKLRCIVSNSRTVQDAILDNRLDLAMVEGPVLSDRIASGFLMEDHLCLIMSPDHPLCSRKAITISDVSSCDLLLREQGSAGRAFLDSVFASRNLNPEPFWESTSTQAIIRAVSKGIGISLLPEKLTEKAVSQGIVVTRPVSDEPLARKNSIIWHKQKFLSDAAKDFIELCRVYCLQDRT